MRKKSIRKGISLALTLAMMVTGIQTPSYSAAEEPSDGPNKLCELTFDGEDVLAAGSAKAEAPNSYSTVSKDDGNAVVLDAAKKQYISLKKADGTGLLAGKEEFVISYDINNLRTATNWAFFAAKDDTEPVYDQVSENYFGCLYSGGNMSVERYVKGRRSAASSSVGTPAATGWSHYDVAVQNGVTHIFKDGKLVATTAKDSAGSITDLTGDNGIFYIGRANWSGGEYSSFQMDNFVVYDGISAKQADQIIDHAKSSLSIGNVSAVKDDIVLPARVEGANVTWKTSDENVITKDGIITRDANENKTAVLTATLSCGRGAAVEKTFDITVLKDDGVSIDDFLLAEYRFEGNAKNTKDEAVDDTAKVLGYRLQNYSGNIAYEKGILGQAVRVGNYGFQLNKKNIGKEFAVSLWLKPDGTLPENMVALFLGYHSPEKWIGVSGNNGTEQVKIWGQGGSLSTWTTLFSPKISANSWHNLVLAGTDGVLTAYLDGVKIGEDNRSNNPLDGANQDIYIAANNWDTQFKGLVDEVKVYSTPISQSDVIRNYYNVLVQSEAEAFTLEQTKNLRENINLPDSSNGMDVSWATSDSNVITETGVITRTDKEGKATLTATFTKGSASVAKNFEITVAAIDDGADVAEVKGKLTIQTFISEDTVLPVEGKYGTSITWESSDENIIDGTGKLGSGRPQEGAGNAKVTLTAVISKGTASDTKEFEVTIMESPYGYILGYVRGSNDRTGSLHLAYSTDKINFTALNANAGILFAKIDTSDGTKNLSTGIRFNGVSLFRNGDGTFGMSAPCGKSPSSYYVYNSKDLLSYTGGNLLTKSDDGYDYYKSVYDSQQISLAGLNVPQGAYGASMVAVTKAEYDFVLQRFSSVKNEGISLKTTSVEAATEAELKDLLPKTVTASYSDGSEAALNVKWDTDSVNMSKPGTYTLTGRIVPYSNPLAEQRADPQIKYDEERNCYYLTSSYPAYNDANHGYDRINLRKAESIQELSDDNGGKEKEITIWKAPASGTMSRHVWAPELHNINGKWYVFFAAGNSDNIWAIRPYVLVCQNNSDPFNADNWKKADGTYEIHMAESKDAKYFKNMSLDMTYFEHNGKHYVIWADIIGQSALYMQEINPDKPWIGISDKVLLLTTPEYGWERDTERVNEGATILKHDGKIFCAFSASGTGPEYCIGMLYADENSDLLDSASWTKLNYPLLTSDDVPGEYGPGHNSFTVDSEGNPVFVYHARSQECYDNKCEWANVSSLYDPCRHARVKNVHWTKDGLPILKMSAEEEIPESMREVEIQVTIKEASKMNLSDAVISGYEEYYELGTQPVKPEITVTYKGTVLVRDKDYTVSYGSNNAEGKGTVTIKAVEGTDYTGEKTAEFNIILPAQLKVHYDMTLTDGKLVNKTGNSAFDSTVTGLDESSFVSEDNTGIMILNGEGYASIPKGTIDDNTFTISVVSSTTKANDQWLWSLGKDSWAYAFMTPTNKDSKTKFTVSKETPTSDRTGAWGSEKTIAVDSKGKDGSFHIYTVVVNQTQTALYIDGKKVGTSTNPYDIKSFSDGAAVMGYIGKSLYVQDPLFNGVVGEFKVYDNALTDEQVASEVKDVDLEAYVSAYVSAQMLGNNTDLNNVKTNLSLPSSIAGKNITWSVPDGQTAIDSNGNVIRPVGGNDVTVKITASWQAAGETRTKEYNVTVKAMTIDSVFDDVTLPYSTAEGLEVYGNITLPQTLPNGVNIKWTADKPEIIDVNSYVTPDYGEVPAGTVKRPASDTVVKLTAEAVIDGKKASKTYEVKVKAAPKKISEDDYTDYFFTYFTGEGRSNGEQIYFSTSEDGMNWTDLNNGQPSLISTLGEKGVRDPFIIRSPEGDKFYVIATDLKINGGNGWGAAQNAGSQSLMVWESTDLVHWSKQRMVEVSASIDAGCTWAPEAIYDTNTGEYIVYWASKTASDGYSKQRLYYAKTRDFYTFTEPRVYIEHDQSSIDTTMIEHNGTYYRYTKNEGGSNNKFGARSKTIFIEKSDGVLGTFTHIQSPSLNSNGGVEGPTIFKLNKDDAETDTWCLLVDNYGAGGYYPLVTTNLESGEFTRPASGTYKMPNGARHGTPIRITREEYCKVMNIPYEPIVTATPAPGGDATPTPPVSGDATPTPPVSGDATPTPPVSGDATPTPPVLGNATPTPLPGGTSPSPAPSYGPGASADKIQVIAAKGSGVTNRSIKVKWTKAEGVEKYKISYAVKGKKAAKTKVTAKSSITLKKLKKNKYYRIRVTGYKMVNGVEKKVAAAKDIYVATKGKYGNPKKIIQKKKAVNISAGQKVSIKAKLKKSKLKVKKCAAKIRYVSTDTAVATVNKSGKVTGISAGKCTVYCMAQNGTYKKVTVNVK